MVEEDWKRELDLLIEVMIEGFDKVREVAHEPRKGHLVDDRKVLIFRVLKDSIPDFLLEGSKRGEGEREGLVFGEGDQIREGDPPMAAGGRGVVEFAEVAPAFDGGFVDMEEFGGLFGGQPTFGRGGFSLLHDRSLGQNERLRKRTREKVQGKEESKGEKDQGALEDIGRSAFRQKDDFRVSLDEEEEKEIRREEREEEIASSSAKRASARLRTNFSSLRKSGRARRRRVSR